MFLDSQSDSPHGRRSVEGVLVAAAFGPDRKYSDFYRLARELRKHSIARGWQISYERALSLVAAAMGHGSYRAAKRASKGGIVPKRTPVLHILNSTEYYEFLRAVELPEYKCGKFTVTAVPSADGEAMTLSARFKQYVKSFFK